MGNKQRPGPALHVRLLGDFRVAFGDEPIATFNTPRLQALLAYLLLHRDAPQSRQQIAFLFWPNSSEEQAQANLRNLLFAFRHALPGIEQYISIDKRTLQWKAHGSASSDMAEFESALAGAQGATDQVRALRKAIDLYGGDLLPGCYDEWIVEPRERLRQQFLDALQQLISLLQGTGDLGTAILYAQLLLRHDPLKEQNYRQLMSLHLANGDSTGALSVYRQCERVLRHDLQVQPGSATRQLAREAQLGNQEAGTGATRSRSSRSSAPNAGGASRLPAALPAQTSAFIGREREVVEITEQLQRTEYRLLTLTGTAGTGKTRLALQVASGLGNADFVDGVVFIPLAPLTEPDMVESTIAGALAVTDSAGGTVREVLLNHLRDRQILLVLDNFEHLLSAAGLVADLLASCPCVKVLATSRSPLNLRGEREHPVPPLAVPGRDMPIGPDELTQYEAVALFVERAIEVSPQFVLTRETARAVAEICRRLEGLPLAIELAAARVKVLSPEAILSRLDSRLKLLVGGKVDLPSRQQTLESAIAWSYNLLNPVEQALLRGLGVFSGGCTLEAAEAVAGGGGAIEQFLDCMSSLVNKSLLSRVDSAPSGSPRFVMLEILREYALDKLREHEEEDVLRREHALYCMGLAEEAEPHLTGPKQREWLDKLEADTDNFRAALRWAEVSCAGQTEAAGEACRVTLRLVGALWRFWLFRGYVVEGREHIAQVLALATRESREDNAQTQAHLARALFGAGELASKQDDYQATYAFNERCLEIRRQIGDNEGILESLQSLGFVAQVTGNFPLARSLFQQTLGMAQESGKVQAIAYSLFHLGEVEQQAGDYNSAWSLYQQSADVGQKAGDSWAQAHTLNKLGSVAQSRGDYEEARLLYERAISLVRDIGHRAGIAEGLMYMGSLALFEGDLASARSFYADSLEAERKLGDRWGIACCLTGFGALAAAEADRMPYIYQQQHARKAARLLAAAQAILDSLGTHFASPLADIQERGGETACRLLGDAEFQRAHAEGRAMTLQEVLVLAEELYP